MGEPGGQGTAGASVIFGRASAHRHATKANFVLVQERRRENGPPSLFAGAPAQPAGTCQAVTGTFPDGIHWVGFTRNDIYVMVSSDRLTEGNLVRYAATAICR
jgi:hypothetical protein